MQYKKFIFYSLFSFVIYTSCAYYNTFFNAEENYRLGVEKLENSNTKLLTKENINLFRSAIGKSWRVISVYGDSNSWADDALLLIAKSHYHLGEFEKSADILDDFLNKFIQSPLRTEAELWKALSLLELGDDENAIQSLNTITSESQDNNILSEAYFRLGEIYFDLKEYQKALEFYDKCVSISGPENITGKAQYKLADTHYKLEEFELASSEYKKVLNYELAVQLQYDAIVQLTNSLLKSNSFEEAEETLQNLLLDQRFKNQFSLIEAKLANMYEFQGDIEYAIVRYNEVIKTYPKTEGSALSYFYLAQIYEFEMGEYDSAKVKYDNVKAEFSKSEALIESNERSKLLAQYIKIRSAITTDKTALVRLAAGDSLVADSIDVASDPLEETADSQDLVSDDEVAEQSIETGDDAGENKTVEAVKATAKPKPKPKKVEIIRDQQEIEESLLRNRYNLAEFFLLTYEHFDSADVAYNRFIQHHFDSLLTPKAYYALYYIYSQVKNNSLKADSIKRIILSEYPETKYGLKLSGIVTAIDNSENTSKKNYISAENLLDGKKYQEAIEAFKIIAEADSGSEWAQKSRYAICYIYENILDDNVNSLQHYAILAKEYPNSVAGKIALNKIKEPPPDIVETVSEEKPDEIVQEAEKDLKKPENIEGEKKEPDIEGKLLETEKIEIDDETGPKKEIKKELDDIK